MPRLRRSRATSIRCIRLISLSTVFSPARMYILRPFRTSQMKKMYRGDSSIADGFIHGIRGNDSRVYPTASREIEKDISITSIER